jgi:hypothetical protein
MPKSKSRKKAVKKKIKQKENFQKEKKMQKYRMEKFIKTMMEEKQQEISTGRQQTAKSLLESDSMSSQLIGSTSE